MKPTEGVPSFGKKTKYRGIEFKSQCEARWAALFDLLGWEWEYEPRGESTFPDFAFTDPERGHTSFLEVKGTLRGATKYSNPTVSGLVDTELARYVLDVDTDRKLKRDWAMHPDAIKARQSATAFGMFVHIGTSDGDLYYPKESHSGLHLPESWTAGTWKKQSEYDWDRTLVMVTGRGKQ